jgi:hypothetical protein
MKKLSLVLLVFLIFSIQAHAELIDRGCGLIYDSDQNITWLQEPNSTRMTWDQAMSWAQNMSVFANGRPITGWRLPTIVNGPFEWGYDGTTTAGCNIATSEMGHLFYTELGNKGYYDVNGNGSQPGLGLVNKGPFMHLQPAYYWADTEYVLDTSLVWNFTFGLGHQIIDNKGLDAYALAVHEGNVGAPPIYTNLDISSFNITKNKRTGKTTASMSGTIGLPALNLVNGDTVNARVTIELFGSIDGGADLIISEEVTLKVTETNRTLDIRKETRQISS